MASLVHWAADVMLQEFGCRNIWDQRIGLVPFALEYLAGGWAALGAGAVAVAENVLRLHPQPASAMRIWDWMAADPCYSVHGVGYVVGPWGR